MKEERKKKCFFFFFVNIKYFNTYGQRREYLKKTNSNVYSKGSEKNVIE